MKNICLGISASSTMAMKVTTLTEDSHSLYPGEPYRPPYLEKVAHDLSANLHDQIPDTVPKEMDHILCMFEEYSGSAEWDRLGCDTWKNEGPESEGDKDHIDLPESDRSTSTSGSSTGTSTSTTSTTEPTPTPATVALPQKYELDTTYQMTVDSEPDRFMRHRGY